ncbi:DUF551 domain-containing protein [Klebsiella pneumoniae]|nr:DUF551 domain-containing protein [Klebsiella pneumoniae]MDE4670960.1 DUF551 domain-containing protein [Klebsiella pneumoniae]
MTKSTITRERMEEIRDCCWMDDLGLSMDELSELARMALAAMDSSESVELPLDYLQGHKDGLEWASQLAEANHPDTGDWLYDDPIELAKAIRKGPDMPPVQPVADSEPDRNPVLAYADSYRDMAKQGVESVPIWSVITDLERNNAPLYRHAQPVPVTEREPIAWLNDAYLARGVVDGEAGSEDAGPGYIPVYREAQPAPVLPDDFDFDRFNDVVWLECVASNPHMHSPTTSIIARVALELNKRIGAGNSPVTQDGWTGNDKANAALMMLDRIETVDPVDDDRIDGIKRIVRELATAPHDTPALNSVQSVDSVADRWIPVSERMPEMGEKQRYVLAADFKNNYWPNIPNTQVGVYGDWFDDGNPTWDDGDGEDLHLKEVTHWMPLPAGPQEVR